MNGKAAPFHAELLWSGGGFNQPSEDGTPAKTVAEPRGTAFVSVTQNRCPESFIYRNHKVAPPQWELLSIHRPVMKIKKKNRF